MFALFINSVGTLFAAGTTGSIQGTVTALKTSLGLPGVKITATAPTGTYSTTSDGRGFFSIAGVVPDTYTVSFELAGYQATAASGVSVFPDNTAKVDQTLDKTLVTIGRTTARSQGGAFQPTQTTDSYTVTSQQIITTQGKDFNNNEVTLIASQPGASLDAAGYPVIRGGRENEEGIQFEGIDYVDAYSNQFTNSLVTNGVASLQVIPGAGNAASGNAGTGTLNLIAKRGTNPAFGTMTAEAGTQTFWHDFGFEYGFATPNGRLSNYFSYLGQRQGELYGNHNTNLVQIGACCTSGNSFNTVNDFVDNLIYKFGPNNNQSLQAFYQGQVVQYALYAGFDPSNLQYRSNQPLALANLAFQTGLDPATVGNRISLFPGQATQTSPLNDLPAYNQPNQAFKLQYNNNINSSTYFDVRVARVAAVTTFEFPVTSPNSGIGQQFQIQQGGSRTIGAFDITKQFNQNNLVTAGFKASYVKPQFSFNDPSFGLIATSQAFGTPGYEVADFITAGSAGCPSTDQNGNPVTCGYLSNFFPSGIPRVPTYNQTATPYFRTEYAAYLTDQINLGKNLRAELGGRFEKANINLGNPVQDFGPGAFAIDKKASQPGFFEPRIAASYQLSKNDSVRASFGSSIQYSFFSNQINLVDRHTYDQFNAIPSFDTTLGMAYDPTNPKATVAKFCGVKLDQVCKNYGDQLFWENQNAVAGQPITPTLPETFTNYDFSYSHAFPHAIGVKITPFYRRGYNATAAASSIIATDANNNPIFGPAVQTNFGSNKTTGVEFLLTKDADYGLSGSLSATYQNGFSNVVPLSGSEDFAPSIPPDSLALGKQYRVGFLSPFVSQLSLQYKTRSGFRINPVINYIRGYPIGPGTTTAFNVNGKSVVVPNTNITSQQGSTAVGQYIDAANPGSFFKPNILATRGTPDTSDPGGILSNARFNTNLTVEFTPQAHKNVTFGVQLYGLFNNVYGYPQLNDRYQPVATGVAGPISGLVSRNSFPFLSQGIVYNYGNSLNGPVDIRGTSPYLIYPNNNFSFTAQTPQTPLFSLFYVQLKL